jgi:hypothetical protein
MAEKIDPFDKTIWDPNNLEHAIEDPMHGSDALLHLLAIPPLRREDGTYYVFGGTYLCGTNTFDANGDPYIKFKSAKSLDFIRELDEHRKWIDAFNAGELPPQEEMGLPEFKFDKARRLMLEEQHPD